MLNLPGDEAVVTGEDEELIGGVSGQTTELNVNDGGTVGRFFDALFGCEVNISGGDVGVWFEALSGSVVNISGGTVGDLFSALDGSEVNFFVGEFLINGEELDTLVPGEAFTINARSVTLSGLLANGEQFSYFLNASVIPELADFFDPNAMLTVTLVPPFVLGDVNLDGVVDFLDINPFIAVLSAATFQAEADCDENGVVDFLDINFFIGILSGN